MHFRTNYKARYKLYKDYMSNLSDIKFTFREVDILACIMNNRGYKKIAQILSISPRTVTGHVYNIMAKLQCNSKDQIIDFIEKSSKALIVREYYNHLLIESSFIQTLDKIKIMVEQEGVICSIHYQDGGDINQENSTNKDTLLEYIQENLKCINIKITNTANNQKKDDNDADTHKNHIQLFIINNNSISNKILSQFQGFGINKTRKIFLLLDDDNIEEKQKNQKTNFISNIPNNHLTNIGYIDFSSSQEYYLQFLLLVEKIFYKASSIDVLNNLIQEFKDFYYSIIKGAGCNITMMQEKSSVNIFADQRLSGLYGNVVVFIIGICVALICVTGGIFIYNRFFSYPSTQTASNVNTLAKHLNGLEDNSSSKNTSPQSSNRQQPEAMHNEDIIYEVDTTSEKKRLNISDNFNTNHIIAPPNYLAVSGYIIYNLMTNWVTLNQHTKIEIVDPIKNDNTQHTKYLKEKKEIKSIKKHNILNEKLMDL